MNIEKADYGTIIKFGTIQDLYLKLEQEGKTLDDVINYIDKDGMSILEKSLVSRKFDIARELLSKGAKVNIVSKEGYNEFHYIASNINCEGALEIAQMLLKKGTSLENKDNKYGNSAVFNLCQEVFKVRSNEGLEFIEECLKRIASYDDCNRAGYSIRMLINERGTEKLKWVLEGRK